MRDQDFCQRLRQIKQKYGYADVEKVQVPSFKAPSPTKNHPFKHHHIDRPMNFNDSLQIPKNHLLSYDQRFHNDIKLDSRRSNPPISPAKPSVNDLPPRFKVEQPLDNIHSANRYHRTSYHCQRQNEYPKQTDIIISSPIKRLDRHPNFQSSPHKQLSPCKTNIPFSTLSPYNRPKPQNKQEFPIKSGRSKYSHHIKENITKPIEKENIKQRIPVQSQLVDNKFTFNIQSIDKIQDRINSALRNMK